MKPRVDLAGLGFALISSPVTAVLFAAAPEESPVSAVLTTHADPARVFERAFWRRHVDTDRVRHAAHREMHAGTRLSSWEWFIVVEPSPALLHYHSEENVFKVRRMDEAPDVLKPPACFTDKDAKG